MCCHMVYIIDIQGLCLGVINVIRYISYKWKVLWGCRNLGIKQMVTFHEIDFLQVCNVGGRRRRRGWEKEEKEKEGPRMGIFWSTSTIMWEDRGIGYFLRWLNQNEVGVEVDIYVFVHVYLCIVLKICFQMLFDWGRSMVEYFIVFFIGQQRSARDYVVNIGKTTCQCQYTLED